MKPVLPDILSWILEDYEANTGSAIHSKTNLEADAHLVIMAGRLVSHSSSLYVLIETAIRPLELWLC